jgi:hypothetical protein
VIVTEVAVVTAFVGRLKLCEVIPAATTTLAEGNADADPVKVTVAPPVGAGPDSVTVTLTLFPPVTDPGDAETELTASAVRLTVVLWDDAARVAVTRML